MKKAKKDHYKYCIVPMCKNTNRTAPDKIYFHIPRDDKIRKKWCKAMRRGNVSTLSTLYCCEDHFNIEEDTENYIQYKIMALEQGQKKSLLLKKNVVPHIFNCQKKEKLRPPPERMGALKRKRQALVEEALSEAALLDAGPSTAWIAYDMVVEQQPLVEEVVPEAGPSTASVLYNVDVKPQGLVEALISEAGLSTAIGTECKAASNTSSSNLLSVKDVLHVNKAVQVNKRVHYRSKGVNVNLTVKQNNLALSPFPLSKNQFVKSPHISGSTFEIPQSAGTDEDDPLSMPASSESTYTTSSENPPQTNELTSPYSIPASPSNEGYDPHANSDMKSEDQSDLNNTIIEYINEQQVKLNKKTVEESEDHRKMFLLSLLPDIRIMSDAQMRKFKSRVLAVVNDILQETLQDPVQNPIVQECKLEIVQSIDNDSN